MKLILNILTGITCIMFLLLPFVSLLVGAIADKGDTKLAIIITLIYGGISATITIIQGKGWEKLGVDKDVSVKRV